MTLFDTRSPDTTLVPELAWSSPDSNLWVASLNGDYAGMVEFTDGHFAVHNAQGESVATCSSIPEAQSALAAQATTTAAPAAVRFLATLATTSPRPLSLRTPKTGYVRSGSVHA